MDNSQWGDTIKVAPGTYQENLNLSDKEIYLIGDSENLPTIMHNPVNGHYSVIEMYNASNTLIKNFRITDGKGTWIGGNHGPNGDNYVGGGIYLTLWEWHDPNSNPFTPRLENLIIEGNSAGYGGGIFSRRTSPRINNCIIQNNTTGEYNGEYGWQGIQGGGLYFMHSETSIGLK